MCSRSAAGQTQIGQIEKNLLFQSGVRKDINILYNTSLGVIFGIKKYAERLMKVAEEK